MPVPDRTGFFFACGRRKSLRIARTQRTALRIGHTDEPTPRRTRGTVSASNPPTKTPSEREERDGEQVPADGEDFPRERRGVRAREWGGSAADGGGMIQWSHFWDGAADPAGAVGRGGQGEDFPRASE